MSVFTIRGLETIAGLRNDDKFVTGDWNPDHRP